MEAALKGAKQIGFTVVSLTVSLMAVFIPLLFMTGIVGRLFREFAITLERGGWRLGVRVADAHADDVRASCCDQKAKTNRSTRASSIDAPKNIWTRLLGIGTNAVCTGCCAHQRFVLIVAIVTLVATILLYVLVPKGLLPQQDTGMIIGVTDAAQNISFKAMVQSVHAVVRYRAAGSGCGQRGLVRSARER